MPRKRNSKFVFFGGIVGNRKNFCRMLVKTNDILRVLTTRYIDTDKGEDIFDAALRELKVDEQTVVSRINVIRSAARLKARLVSEPGTDNSVVSYQHVYDLVVNESLEKWGLEE